MDFNPLQQDFDGDRLGNACDLDDDNDGIADTADPNPLNPNLPGGNVMPSLVLNQVNSNLFGFRFEGLSNHRESLELDFDASGSDLLLQMTGFDIDIASEVRVLVNGTQLGFLARTPNNGRGPTELTISQSLLRNTGNTLRFEQKNPGWIWAVTDLLVTRNGN